MLHSYKREGRWDGVMKKERMQKLVFIVASILILLLLRRGNCLSTHEAILGKEKVSHLHFFFHDVVSGKNPTAVQVASANNTPTLPTTFGSIVVIDDLLTVGPEPNSTVVGNAQGIYVATGKEKFSLLIDADFEFTAGEFNGSSISVLSRNPVLETDRELAVVGGRGKFRYARGVAKLRTHFVNFTSGDAIVEYRVIVLHYE